MPQRSQGKTERSAKRKKTKVDSIAITGVFKSQANDQRPTTDDWP
jgi:hypothetical protein